MPSGSKVNSEVCGNLIQENGGISPVLNTVFMIKTSAVPQHVAHPERRECCVISVISQLWYHTTHVGNSLVMYVDPASGKTHTGNIEEIVVGKQQVQF
jgi:16S rRNA A1518/A1519 N6-dimethyltransferase RsmA/KsgA/DIM1 with predicted DNA glycosylase/AP lyase activity